MVILVLVPVSEAVSIDRQAGSHGFGGCELNDLLDQNPDNTCQQDTSRAQITECSRVNHRMSVNFGDGDGIVVSMVQV